MSHRFDPEALDLAELRQVLEGACGSFVEGEIVGRSLLRDELVVHLECSVLEAERTVDTMIGRGFLRKLTLADGRTGWSTTTAGSS